MGVLTSILGEQMSVGVMGNKRICGCPDVATGKRRITVVTYIIGRESCLVFQSFTL